MSKEQETGNDDFNKSKKRFTQDEADRIIQVMRDDAVYKCIKGFLEALMSDEGMRVIRALRSDKSDDQEVKEIRESKATVKVLDKILYYINLWRKKAVDTAKENPKKEDKNGRKKERS